MTDDGPSLTDFFIELMEREQGRMKRAVDGLADEQLYSQPAQESNSIGWLVWHLSREKDNIGSLVSGETEVWVSDGWAQRFGLPESGNGNGDTPEQVSAFRADRDLLLGYADAAHSATLRRVQEASKKQLTREWAGLRGAPRPAWKWLVLEATDYAEHTGQIAYLRGMLTGLGWL